MNRSWGLATSLLGPMNIGARCCLDAQAALEAHHLDFLGSGHSKS